MIHGSKRFLSAGCVALVACVLQLACAPARGDDLEQQWKGKPAPAVSIKMLDGKPLDLAGMKGKVVVVDLWATWCPPCRASLPHIQEMSQNKELADQGLMVVAVNHGEQADKVKPFLEQNKYTFPVALDPTTSLGTALQVQGIPTTLVIGRDGNIANVFVGFGDGSPALLEKAVKAALAVKM